MCARARARVVRARVCNDDDDIDPAWRVTSTHGARSAQVFSHLLPQLIEVSLDHPPLVSRCKISSEDASNEAVEDAPERIQPRVHRRRVRLARALHDGEALHGDASVPANRGRERGGCGCKVRDGVSLGGDVCAVKGSGGGAQRRGDGHICWRGHLSRHLSG